MIMKFRTGYMSIQWKPSARKMTQLDVYKRQALDPAPADDFDVHGYQPTPQENWALYDSLDNEMVDISTHTLVVKSDGTVWAWGDNSNGQTGNSDGNVTKVPTQVAGLSGVTAVAAGKMCIRDSI